MKSNKIVLFLNKKKHLKSQFIHFYIEELAESLIEFSIEEKRFIKEKKPSFERKIKSPY